MTNLYPVYCSWCQTIIRYSTTPNSHGICKKCKEELDREVDEMRHKAINFSPFANNILDFLGQELKMPDGTKVVVTKPAINFIIRFNDHSEPVFESDDNLAISYFLNQREVGK